MERIFCCRCSKDWVQPDGTGKDEFGNRLQRYRCPTCSHRVEFVVESPVAAPASTAVQFPATANAQAAKSIERGGPVHWTQVHQLEAAN